MVKPGDIVKTYQYREVTVLDPHSTCEEYYWVLPKGRTLSFKLLHESKLRDIILSAPEIPNGHIPERPARQQFLKKKTIDSIVSQIETVSLKAHAPHHCLSQTDSC